jgi:hypothetical protein
MATNTKLIIPSSPAVEVEAGTVGYVCLPQLGGNVFNFPLKLNVALSELGIGIEEVSPAQLAKFNYAGWYLRQVVAALAKPATQDKHTALSYPPRGSVFAIV